MRSLIISRNQARYEIEATGMDIEVADSRLPSSRAVLLTQVIVSRHSCTKAIYKVTAGSWDVNSYGYSTVRPCRMRHVGTPRYSCICMQDFYPRVFTVPADGCDPRRERRRQPVAARASAGRRVELTFVQTTVSRKHDRARMPILIYRPPPGRSGARAWRLRSSMKRRSRGGEAASGEGAPLAPAAARAPEEA